MIEPMTQNAAQLLEQALQLPEDERADLAAHLLESLPDDAPDKDVDWNVELKNRLDEIDQGKVQPVPWSEVHARLLTDIDDASKR
jgi:putative addiction module component (TIGR02574 family)